MVDKANSGYKAERMKQYEKDGVTMVWHYNAFLSYDVEPVKEVVLLMDEETANLTQVECNAYLLEARVQKADEVFEQMRLTEQLYANALALWEEQREKETNLDKRA